MMFQSRKQPFSVQKRQSAFAEIRSQWRKKPHSVRYSSPLASCFGSQPLFCSVAERLCPRAFADGSQPLSCRESWRTVSCKGLKISELRCFNISPKGAVNFLQQPRNIATG